ARLAAARRGDGDQPRCLAMVGLHHRGGLRRARRRSLRLRQGQRLPDLYFDFALDRRVADGAARRGPDGQRPGDRRDRLRRAAGRDRARHRSLAALSRSYHHRARPRLPAGHRRLRRGALRQAAGRSRHRGGAMNDLLRVEHLAKSFGGVAAVVDVSFTLKEGELLALIGPNGAGKSTCFNLLNGQTHPDSGRIFLGADEITSALRPRAADLYVEEAIELLRVVGMAEQAWRPCAILAYGDLKRVELALALANEPRLLLMDEPTAGMAA